MRSVSALVVVFASGCGNGSNPPNAGPPVVAADEVATPTEMAPPQQASAPALGAASSTKAPRFPAVCKAIASDLEKLTRQFPQLAHYRAVDQQEPCRIRYHHKTQRPSGRGGGYSAGIPRAEPDGIYLYLSIWDPNGSDIQQLDSQPMSAGWIGDRRVTFVIDEGDRVKRAAGAIRGILERHGLTQR